DDIRVFALEDEEVGISNRSQVKAMSANANKQIGANIVHASGNTGVGRKIVILDTGYNYSHPELSSSYLGGKDFVNNDNNPMDDNGHGSHVAGIITADGIDPKAKGVAPDTGIIAGKVLDQNGSGYFSDVVAAIYWAVDGTDGVPGTGDEFGADAINMSLGTGAPYVYKNFCNDTLPDLTTAVKYAVDKNITIVVAAGNSGNAGVSIPGCISYSTTVGAVNGSDQVASFSGRGNALDITAPGVNIYSSVLASLYATWSGTSMATPMVAGVVALMKYAHPTYSQNTVENKLFSTAKDLGKIGKDTNYGWGRVNAAKAVE
ncbi:MAG: S8 family serine peptidase, partial [Patescibacteria group bacterium]